MGLAGALFAHKIAYLAPDIFTILLSIQLLLLVIVGGLGSLHGAIFGAIFVALLPPVIAILRDSIPATFADIAGATGLSLFGSIGEIIGSFLRKPGVEAGIFGLILVLVILLEPLGMYGRWMKTRLFFSTFPMYKRATFKRQKTYMKSERLR
jgi:branched-chain amino acid transport system permease protein